MTPHEAQNAGEPWMDQTIEKVVLVKLNAKFAPWDYFAWRLGPTIFQALMQQLDLSVDAQKGPVSVMVIDHMERPSENELRASTPGEARPAHWRAQRYVQSGGTYTLSAASAEAQKRRELCLAVRTRKQRSGPEEHVVPGSSARSC
jgi:hypothetical protein